LNAYIVAREKSEKKNSMDKNKNKPTNGGTQGNPNSDFKKQAHGPISSFGHRRPTSTFGPKRMSQNERIQVASGEAHVSNDGQRYAQTTTPIKTILHSVDIVKNNIRVTNVPSIEQLKKEREC
jgi:hypothetical protein